LKRYPAGIACWYTGPKVAEHNWPNNTFYGSYVEGIRYNNTPVEGNPYSLDNNLCSVVNNTDGSIVGYKYFNFDNTQSGPLSLLLTIIPKGIDGTIEVMADRPWESQGGISLGKVEVKADMPLETTTELEIPLPTLSELTGKHAIFLKFSSEVKEQSICSLEFLTFSK